MSDYLKETYNFQRFIVLFIDVGTKSLLKVFDYIDRNNPVGVIFPISTNSSIAKEIQNKFHKKQYYSILAAKSPAEFDISTLLKLLCEVFSDKIPPSLIPNLGCLRSIRNTVVAHSTTARLSKNDFDKNVEDFEICIKRIIHEVDPGSENTLADTIEEYIKQYVDAATAREYCLNLNKQIEELRTTFTDVTKLCKNIQTPFLKYVKFLLNCGSSILSAYLRKLLEKQTVSLERLLYDNHTLMSRKLPEWMAQQLYPESGHQIEVNADTMSWDLSVLAEVIEIIFGKDIEEYDLTAIISIKRARVNYANTAVFAITKDDRFNREREDLVVSLQTLAMHTGQGSYHEFMRFFELYRSSSETSADSKEYFAKLKCHGPGIKDITDLHRESVEKLTAETECTIFVNENNELEVMLQVACEDSSKQAEAESVLHSFLESILANPKSQPKGPDFPEVRTTIEKINNIPTVRLICVQKSCLLLTVECRSSQGLLRLINFIDGSEFLRQLDLISAELMDNFDDLFILNGHVTLDSLVTICMRKDKKNSSPFSMGVEDFGNDHEKIIYERQGQERKLQKIEIPESIIRQDPDISKHEAVIKHLQKKLEAAEKLVKDIWRLISFPERKSSKVIKWALLCKNYNLQKENAKLAKRLIDLEKVHAQQGYERELEEKHRKDWTLTLLVYTAINERQLCRQATNQLYDLRRVNIHQSNQILILTNEISQLKRDKIDLANQIYRLKQFEDDLIKKIRVLANDRRFKKRLSSLGLLSLTMKSTPSGKE